MRSLTLSPASSARGNCEAQCGGSCSVLTLCYVVECKPGDSTICRGRSDVRLLLAPPICHCLIQHFRGQPSPNVSGLIFESLSTCQEMRLARSSTHTVRVGAKPCCRIRGLLRARLTRSGPRTSRPLTSHRCLRIRD